jgi:hypothetical protein
MPSAARLVTNINPGVARSARNKFILLKRGKKKKGFETELHVLSNV